MAAVPRPPAGPRETPAAPRKFPSPGEVINIGPGPAGRWHKLHSTEAPRTPGASSGDVPAAPPPPEEGEAAQIDPGRLVLGASVGTGGTAEVFHGHFDGQVVAIKQLFRHKKMNVKEEISFNREVRVLAAITHPNLVRFYGVAFKERPYRIVTEFCQGGTCFDLIHNGSFKLKWAQRLKMVSDTACGMDYLHSCMPQIIHRDLKSLNLLLEKEVASPVHVPVVKVSDFGLSRMRDPGASWGKMTSQVGTLHWMAPEVFAGQDYDESVDVYSYAMVMFEALCQEVPFEDTDPGLIGQLTVKGVRPDLGRVPKDCPPMLLHLMVACWAHEAKARPKFKLVIDRLAEAGADVSAARNHQPCNRASGKGSRPASAKDSEAFTSRSRAVGPYSSISL